MHKKYAVAVPLVAEGIGTYILVFAGTGAVMVDSLTQGAITHLGVSFVFGAIVAALIYALGHISGAHFNPAVTLCFWQCRFFPGKQVLAYIAAQLCGASAASLSLLLTLGRVGNLGATLPLSGNWAQSLVLETILTFILMLVILGSGIDRRAPSGFAGLAIGLTVAVEAACMGPICGASMNPARSFGPAAISGIWQHHWLYWIGPIGGAYLAGIVYTFLSHGFHDLPQETAQ